jgi:hypothetical protein
MARHHMDERMTEFSLPASWLASAECEHFPGLALAALIGTQCAAIAAIFLK